MIDALPLFTPRLAVRRFQPSDVDRFAACRADAGLARFQGWSPMSPDDARAFVMEMSERRSIQAGEWIQFAVASRGDDAFAGDIGLCVRESEAEIGFTFMRDMQGKGLATEAVHAFCQLLLARGAVAGIVAITDERNRASIRVLERVGMKLASRHEGVFKQEACVELRYELRQR